MICAPLGKCTSNALGRIALSFQMHLKCIRVCCPFILNALQMLSAWSSFALRCTSSACGWSRLHLESIANAFCLVIFCFKVHFKCFWMGCPFKSNAFRKRLAWLRVAFISNAHRMLWVGSGFYFGCMSNAFGWAALSFRMHFKCFRRGCLFL